MKTRNANRGPACCSGVNWRSKVSIIVSTWRGRLPAFFSKGALIGAEGDELQGDRQATFEGVLRAEQTKGPYELTEGAGGAANLNREMIRLLDFAEQLEQAGESILSLRRGREMRLIVHLVRHYLSGQLTTTSSLAAASGLSYGAAMRPIRRMKSRGLIVERTRTATGKSFSLHATAKLLGQWQEYASRCRILVGSAFRLYVDDLESEMKSFLTLRGGELTLAAHPRRAHLLFHGHLDGRNLGIRLRSRDRRRLQQANVLQG